MPVCTIECTYLNLGRTTYGYKKNEKRLQATGELFDVIKTTTYYSRELSDSGVRIHSILHDHNKVNTIALKLGPIAGV